MGIESIKQIYCVMSLVVYISAVVSSARYLPKSAVASLLLFAVTAPLTWALVVAMWYSLDITDDES